MNEIEKYIAEQNYDEAVQECLRHNLNHLGVLLSNITSAPSHHVVKQFHTNINGIKTDGKIVEENIQSHEIDENPPLISDEETEEVEPLITVKLLANWTSSESLRDVWNKMSQGNYTWNNIRLVTDDDPDYFVVVNAPPTGDTPDPSKTIVFQMEPWMEQHKDQWKEWATPDPSKFFKVCCHKTDYNNNEWHLSKTYNELKTETIVKNNDLDGIVSTVLSAKYSDPGHVKRIDFVKYLEKQKFPVHVFGDNKWGYVDYKGSLPYHQKDNAMFPYKYVFNCENNSIKNYYTEKLIDGILAECLVFYSGCYNIKEFIDERAFVYLELNNFEDDYKKVKEAVEGNLWEERIPYIRREKFRILNHLQFFPRLDRIINKTEGKPYDESEYLEKIKKEKTEDI
jgi:hypothetical protein